MKTSKQFLTLLLSALALLIISCKKDPKTNTPDVQTFYGSSTPLGKGTVRSFVVKQNGKPFSLGFRVSESASSELPSDSTREWEYPVSMPAEAMAKVPGFDHLVLDWNPVGHDPKAIYGLPHFDFHFYRITEAEQANIPGGQDQVPVPAQYIPQDYSPGPVSVPEMGVHWFDVKAPEFAGQKFTDTYIYGFSQGQLAFTEPMVTLTFLQSRADFKIDIKQPQAWQKSGYYPMVSHVYWDSGSKEYVLALETLTYKNAE